MDKAERKGLTVLSAYEVSLLLGESVFAPFVLSFKKRQAREHLRIHVASGVVVVTNSKFARVLDCGAANISALARCLQW